MFQRPPRRPGRRDRARGLSPALDRLEERRLLTLQLLPIAPVEAIQFSGPVATFADTDLPGNPATFTAKITWGDGTEGFGTIVPNAGNTVWTVYGSNTYHAARSYQLGLTVGSTTAQLSASGGVNVAALPITVTAGSLTGFAGGLATGTAAVFTDSYPGLAPSAYQVDISWGDNSTGTGAITYDSTSKFFSVAGEHRYATAGTYSVGVKVTRLIDHVSASSTFSTTITGGLMSVSPRSAATLVSQPLASSTVLATFTDSDPTRVASDFSSSIDWGDGTSGVGVISQDATTKVFSVAVPSGSHVYTQAGSPAVKVVVTRLTDSYVAPSVSPTVTVTNPAIVLQPATYSSQTGVKQAGTVATFSDAYPNLAASDYTATIDWGDGTTDAGTVQGSSGRFTIVGAHSYRSPNTYAITVTLTRLTTGTTVALSGANGSTAVAAAAASANLIDAGAYTDAYGVVWNVNRPSFRGTAPAGSVVRLTGVGGGFIGDTVLGQTVADSSGAWVLGTGPLPDGIYNFKAVVVPPIYPTAASGTSPRDPIVVPVTVGNSPGGRLKIDTVPPRVIGVSVDRSGRTITVQFDDPSSGMNTGSLAVIGNYAVVARGVVGPRSIATVPITAVNIVPNDSRSVSVRLRLGGSIRPGRYKLLLAAANLIDIAGNHLVYPSNGMVIPSLAPARKAR